MIVSYLSSLWTAALPVVADHLWQSTLFAAVAGVLALLLRKDQARVRYWLWLAASLKFLFPFALLVGLGSTFAVSGFHTARQGAVFAAMEQVSQPFVRPVATVIPAAAPGVSPSCFGQWLPALLVAIWLSGFLLVLFTWCVRWRQMWKVLKSATPLVEGRELEALRRLEGLAGVQKHIPVFLSRASFEPGIFGVFRPVLILPEWICERLSEKHLRAVLAHEVWHVRRRDNLAAAVHMLVQALFWFHPLVWWLGGRLVEERERACDEQVLKLGNSRQIYAESILKVCEFSVESPLACVSGITGADLKGRISQIMSGRVLRRLDFCRKLLLGAAGLTAIALPITFGITNAQQAGSLSKDEVAIGESVKFKQVSVKPFKTDTAGHPYGFSIMDPPNTGEFYATGITLQELIQLAYGVRNFQILGGPSWANSEKFDIQAKSGTALDTKLRKLSRNQGERLKRHMLQMLLSDCFRVKLRRESKKLPVYALVVAGNGPKFQQGESGTDRSNPQRGSDETSLEPPGTLRVERTPLGRCSITGHAISTKGLARALMGFPLPPVEGQYHVNLLAQMLVELHILHRTGPVLTGAVVDRTGLKGKYDMHLQWTSDEGHASMRRKAHRGEPIYKNEIFQSSSGPSVFEAVREQLGLRLKPSESRFDVIVFAHVEKPSIN